MLKTITMRPIYVESLMDLIYVANKKGVSLQFTTLFNKSKSHKEVLDSYLVQNSRLCRLFCS